MYIPKHYQNNNQKTLVSFIKANPFGILVTQGGAAAWATHIPFMIKGNAANGYELLGHLSKANAQWQAFEHQKQVLVIFNGPQHYISASWYKEEEVPTWDYIAVHATGKISVLPQEALLVHLHELVHEHEKEEKNPVSLEKMSERTKSQYKGVVGFSIKITKLEGAYKLSQTRKEDHLAIKKALCQKDSFQAKEVAKAITQASKK